MTPFPWCARYASQRARVLQHSERLHLTKYKGLDPEVGAMYGDALMTGLDYGRYPSPRIYTFGLNVSF